MTCLKHRMFMVRECQFCAAESDLMLYGESVVFVPNDPNKPVRNIGGGYVQDPETHDKSPEEVKAILEKRVAQSRIDRYANE